MRMIVFERMHGKVGKWDCAIARNVVCDLDVYPLPQSA